MIENIIELPLERIKPNPYQPRTSEDKEHIEKLAVSIAQQGLLQIPAGRLVNGASRDAVPTVAGIETQTVELAFGHSRLAAFRLLNDIQHRLENRIPTECEENSLFAALVTEADRALENRRRFSMMPVVIRDMTNEEMFSAAISENVSRKDLTPIEVAKAMLRWREEFKKTSSQIGQIFHMSESAARNKMRLLDLPEQAKEALASGNLSEVAARQLLSVKQTISADELAEVTSRLAKGDFTSPQKTAETIGSVLRQHADAMWGHSWQTGPARGGKGLWELDRKFKRITPSPSLDVFKSAYQGTEDPVTINYPEICKDIPEQSKTYDFKTAYNYLVAYVLAGYSDGLGRRLADQLPEVVLLLKQLIDPPACTPCAHYTRLDGMHYCGLKACRERKKKAYLEDETDRLSQKLGIPIYDKRVDGKFEEAFDGCKWKWVGGNSINIQSNYPKWFKEKATFLRLRPKYSEYEEHPFTESYCVELVGVGEVIQKRLAEIKQATEEATKHQNSQEQRWKTERQNRDLSDKFLKVIAAPVLASALSPLDKSGIGLVEWLSNSCVDKGLSREDCFVQLRVNWMLHLLENRIQFDLKKQGPLQVAKHLQGLAKTWGYPLPENWLASAQAMDLQAVSTETVPEDDNGNPN